MSPRRVVAVLAAFTFGLAACSSGSDEAGSGDAIETTSTLLSTDEASADEGTGEASADEASADEATGDVVPAGVDIDRFCELRNDAEVSSDEFFAGSDAFDPVEMEDFLQDQIDSLTEASVVAPDELIDDVAVQIDEMTKMDSILEEFDYNILAAGPRLEADLGGPAVDDSGAALEAFSLANCPEVPAAEPAEPADGGADEGASSDGSEDGFSDEDILEAEQIFELLQDPEGRAAFVDVVSEDDDLTVEQAECLVDGLSPQLLLEIDLVDRDGADAATPEVIALFDECGIDVVAFGAE